MSTKQELIETIVDTLSNDEVHDLLCHLTKRFIILNWYVKEDIEMITKKKLDDNMWKELLRTQDEMSQQCNEIIEGHLKTKSLNNMHSVMIENPDCELEVMLLTLTNKQLQKYAGVTNNSMNKQELVDIIMKQLNENANKVTNKKMERLFNLLK